MIHPNACVKCESPKIYKHGSKITVFRDTPFRAKHTVISAKLTRYRCKDCGSVFVQPVTQIYQGTRMTERCVEYIQRRCLKDTFKRIADDVGCDDRTVRKIASDYVSQLNKIYNDYPVISGYTEALNGVEKVIKRSGRGYTFEMLRARALFNKYELFEPPCFNVDPDINAEEFKVLEDSFVRCLSCFEPKTPEDHSIVCKRCLFRLHHDDLFLEVAKKYGLR